jgi:DNA-3-methyladenine glycosylase II
VELRQSADDQPVTAVVHGDCEEQAVRRQVARFLSLDNDGEAFRAVGDRDPVIAGLQRAYPGQRPVLFCSPYEAAAWSIISARQRGIPAATVRRTLCERLGTAFTLAGVNDTAFPEPVRLLGAADLDVPGLNAEKQACLRGVAGAARQGLLDVGKLQSLGPEKAQAALQQLRGIGPVYAGLIVLRATGFADAMLPMAEPKVLAHAAHFYGLPAPRALSCSRRWPTRGVLSEHGQPC